MLLMVGGTSAFAQAKITPAEATGVLQSSHASATFMGEYDFTLHNKAKGWVINGFYTLQNGKWSKNWLSGKLASGSSIKMMWSSASDEGACVVPFKVSWEDYGMSEQFNVDWCKKPKSISMLDEGFKID